MRMTLTHDDCRILRRLLSLHILQLGLQLKKAPDNRRVSNLAQEIGECSLLRERFWALDQEKTNEAQ